MDIDKNLVSSRVRTKKKIVTNERIPQNSHEKTIKNRVAVASQLSKETLIVVQTQTGEKKSTRQNETVYVESDDENTDALTLDLVSSDDENIGESANRNAQINEDKNENTTENILFIKYFKIVEDKKDAKKNIAACCLTCGKDKKYQVIVRGSLLATSNFIRHLKVIF